jgi:hypothetical protein
MADRPAGAELLAFVGSGRRVTQAVRLAPGDVVALARALDARARGRGDPLD